MQRGNFSNSNPVVTNVTKEEIKEMLKEREVKVRFNSRNKKYYENLGFTYHHKNDIIVPIYLLSRGSHVKVTGICDICGKEKTMEFRTYFKMLRENGYYQCHYCKVHTNKNHLKYKTGYENQFQIPFNKEKSKQTMLKKYGVEFNTQREVIRHSMEGVLNYFYIDGRNKEYKDRHNNLYKKWRKQILEKFNYTCYVCGSCKNLEVHHLYGFEFNPDSDYDINNGVVLCKCCHKKYHADNWELGKKSTYTEFITWLQENSTDYRNHNSIRDSRAKQGVE